MNEQLIDATLTATGHETDPVTLANLFNVHVSGSFTGTVTLYRRFWDPDTKTWQSWLRVEGGEFTAPADRNVFEPVHPVQYKLRADSITSGSAYVRLGVR